MEQETNYDVFKGTSGPRDAKVAIVGEAYGQAEEATGRPFVGQSGQEFRRMLAEAGINFDQCFVTNVVNARPPGNEFWEWFTPSKEAVLAPVRGLHPSETVRVGLDNLHMQLRAVRPKVIVAAGNYALWALTNQTGFTTRQDTFGRRVPNGIEKWRGSLWYANAVEEMEETFLLPVYHPASILRAWYNRAITVHDLRRVEQGLTDDWRPKVPPVFLAPPTFDQAISLLNLWSGDQWTKPFRLQCDIETKFGLMTCNGFSTGPEFAMSIPFVRPNGNCIESYWTEEEEIALNQALRRLLGSGNILVEGQNFLYDIQFLQKFLAVTPHISYDDLLAQHLLFPGTPKDLVYLSSLYCHHHWYWKDDHKEWDLKQDLNRLLEYNCTDCVRQFEVATNQRPLIEQFGLQAQWEEQLAINQMALEMMNRGIKVNKQQQAEFAVELQAALDDTSRWILSIVPQNEVNTDAKTPWYRSDKQIREFFGDDLGLRLPRHRKTGAASFGKEALVVLKEKHPEFIRLFEAIENFRKLRTFHKNFISAPLDFDGRIRCMFGRTETFRFTSSENAFGRGTNLQNIPSGNEE